ncbi:uncharacterized protein KRP23_322 [Phytophthora ramorum]|uniref:uncharacterized protein n=1 Tax=Phytophthora ramorum TaxID=164328 RepID=UPI0030B156EF|nr:hypothetical protein KRP23_322 [Phytophthora ramorum]
MALLNRILDSQALLQSSHEDVPWSIRSLMLSQAHYQTFQFTLSLLEAAKRRDLEMTMWLFEHFRGFAVPQSVVKEAAAAGASELLEYYLDYDINARSADEYSDEERDLSRPVAWGGTDAADAIRAGQRDIAAWMYRYVYVDHRDEVGTLKAAVATGDVQMVEMLQEKLDMDCDRGIQEAAANGHLDMVQCMYEQELEEMYDKGVVLAAATNGHLDVVRWLIHLDSSGDRQAPSQLCRQTLKQTGQPTRKRKTEQNI